VDAVDATTTTNDYWLWHGTFSERGDSGTWDTRSTDDGRDSGSCDAGSADDSGDSGDCGGDSGGGD
jgi:hypothetical protein